MTFRRVIGTSGTLCLAPEIIRMGMVPFWVAIKVSPLAVWMVMGGVSYIVLNSERFPEMWLEAAESANQ